MHRAAWLFARKGDDHPFDLPPVTEADDIAPVPRALGQLSGREGRIVAMGVHQRAGIGQRLAGSDEGENHDRRSKRGSGKAAPRNRLRKAFTILSCPSLTSYEAPMSLPARSPAGGGCLILAGFLIGAMVGIVRGQPSLGVLLGVSASALLLVILWLVGRRKG